MQDEDAQTAILLRLKDPSVFMINEPSAQVMVDIWR